MSPTIFHIDVNSAYLSWIAAYQVSHGENLDIRDVPSVVGGDMKKRRGIVLAKSIPAKKYGIKTGESLYSAFQKCPHLISVPPDYSLFMKASNSLVDLVYEYSPIIQRFSVDEMFMEYVGKKDEFMNEAIAISRRAEKELGFTVNIGISTNKLLAKVASDFTKPNRIHTLFPHEIEEKMWNLDVGDLFGVGSRTKKKFNERCIKTIGDLARLDPDYIYKWLKKPGLQLWQYANGIDNSPVRTDCDPIKSIGNSTTTSFDVDNINEAHKVLLAISEMVGLRLRKEKKLAGVIAVGIKDNEFLYFRKERKLPTPTATTTEIFQYAKKLLSEIWDGTPLRQFSIHGCSLISDRYVQLSLFQENTDKLSSLDRKIDQLRNKYGMKIIQRGSFLHSGISPVIGGVVTDEEYKMMSSIL